MQIGDRVTVTAGPHWAREGILLSIEAGIARIELDKPVKGRMTISVPVDAVQKVRDEYLY